ncbi:PD-(D/E)XK nuclease family protein [Nitriliruptoraceae bacterium ZYF776]|nr:PD-(D/E)XK nuclease family protein [Profundirhabdus halotolerans]
MRCTTRCSPSSPMPERQRSDAAGSDGGHLPGRVVAGGYPRRMSEPDPTPVPAPGTAEGADAAGPDEVTGLPEVPVVDADGALRLLDVEAAPPGTYGELEPASPPLIDAQGRVRLSFSRVDTYQLCPRKFRYAYVDKLPGRPGPHLSFGTSIHNALEAFYDRKLPACPTEEELLGFLYEGWDTSGFVDLPREEQLDYYRHAQQVLRRFHRRAAPSYRLPAATEAWFELPVGYEATVVGSIDRVDVDDEGRLHVVDYKTNRKVKDRARVAGSLQLAIYALACRHLYGALPATVSLDFVVAGVEVVVPLEELDLEGARQAVLDTAAAVRAEHYPPTPTPLCGWCDFRSLCPAWPDEGEPADALGPAVRHLRDLRREVARGVRELREAEAGVTRLAEEVAEAEDTPAVREAVERAAELRARRDRRRAEAAAAEDAATAAADAPPPAAPDEVPAGR